MTDERFAALGKDPRYRLPNRKQARTKVDPRFSGLFTDQEFRRKAKVDRYGREIKADEQNRQLARLYRLDDGDSDIENTKASEKHADSKAADALAIASQEEEEEEDEVEDEDEEDEEKGKTSRFVKRDRAREGFSESSSSEEESSEEEQSDDEAELAEKTAGQEQTEDIPLGEVSLRIAAVNMDWDNIRAADILAVANSFVPKNGRVANVTIYPSEFGRERLQREELEGPPREIFASSKTNSTKQDTLPSSRPSSHRRDEDDEGDSDSEESVSDTAGDEKIKQRLLEEQVGDAAEFDTANLRRYQLERLRYYYAVIECDSTETAKSLYDAMDGREYLSSANFFDLRFIPDSVSFDDDNPHDECVSIPPGHKPNEFRTEALTHSKVKLTWDDDDPTRKEVQRRAFSRAEIDENDLQAYIGSESSDADSISSRVSTAADRRKKKKEAQKQKMRSAFGLSLDSSTSRGTKQETEAPVGDMQITFTPGLSAANSDKGVFLNEPQDEESTRARYIRKEKERKQKRKEKVKASRNPGADETQPDHADDTAETAEPSGTAKDPFDDPFFDDPIAAGKASKAAEKLAKRRSKAAESAKSQQEHDSRQAELALLMTGDGQEDGVRHFDMREIEKARKDAKRKKFKSKSKTDGKDEVVDDFKLDPKDARFNALFSSHEYAIDPTNPRFTGTENMKSLLDEGRKKRRAEIEEDDGNHIESRAKKSKSVAHLGPDSHDPELSSLVARLKKKQKGGR